MTAEDVDAATRIVRALTGGRWTWPPVRVRELYVAPTGKLMLRGRPVRSITSVKRYSDGSDLDYTAFLGGRIELNGQVPPWCSARIDRVDVTYEYGSEPPIIAQRAIAELSKEFELAGADTGECRLPDRIVSINRQGVSWTLIDPQDFLDKGRTGIYEVDIAIRALGSSRARSAVYSPEYPPPERISIEALPAPVP